MNAPDTIREGPAAAGTPGRRDHGNPGRGPAARPAGPPDHYLATICAICEANLPEVMKHHKVSEVGGFTTCSEGRWC
jgi:hypothetical protein